MAMASWTGTVQDGAGNAVAGAQIEVRRESDNALVQVYADRLGEEPMGNPFNAAEATVSFHAMGGAYRIKATLGGLVREWRSVAIGTMGERDDDFVLSEVAEITQTAADGGDPDADGQIPTVARVSQLIASGGSSSVATRAALKALDTNINAAVMLTEAGREGYFVFMAGNFTVHVNNIDPQEGVFIKADDKAGSAGAWVRVFDEGISAKWFGAKGDDVTNDTAALQAWVDFHDQFQWRANFNSQSPANLKITSAYLYLPPGIYRINPAVGVRIWDKCDIRGAGTTASLIKAHTTGAGRLIYRFYNGTANGNGRVQHIKISGIRGVVTGANQIIFDIQHVGRGEIFDVEGGTQDRVDEFNNAKQRYWPGTALFRIGVGDSIPNGYVNGSDILELHHFTAYFLDYGIRGSSSANQKQPERLLIHNFECSDTHQPIVLNASAGMIGHIHDGTVQRWGSESIRADTGVAGPDNYGVDIVGNKYKVEDFYFEANSAFAALFIRSGTANIVDVSSMNRYGTTTTILSNSGTGTITR